jgi:uncharacterized RDD family membrane protein YckC
VNFSSESSELEYAGFWLRVWATVIDTFVIGLVILPVLGWFYGRSYVSGFSSGFGFAQEPSDWLLSCIVPAAVVVIFWATKQATPGKMAIAARVVDARTGGKPTISQWIIRYIGYYVCIFPLCLGLLWVAFDARKQGWHDKMAGTVVVRKKGGLSEPVKFSGN